MNRGDGMAESKNPAGRRNNAGTARNTAQLEREIESGAHRDAVSHPDPGAAPLGTDDEAAGHPADTPTDAGIGSTAPPQPS
jgi:hypothetical protein